MHKDSHMESMRENRKRECGRRKSGFTLRGGPASEETAERHPAAQQEAEALCPEAF